MADVFRRCGCRDEEGKQYSTKRQCPKMSNPRHGSWCFRASAGTKPDGSRRYIPGSGYKTAKEAREARGKALRKYKGQGDRFFDRTTLADYLTEWIDRRAALPVDKGGLKPSTTRMYRSYISKDIIPALGEIRLVKLARNDVAGFIDDLIDAERGATTIHRIHAALSSALTNAVKRGFIDANPASLHDLPEISAHPIKVWEQADAIRFLEEARHGSPKQSADQRKGHRLAPLFEFAISTGLRRGEVCGLKWEDIDMLHGQLTVRRNLVQVGPDVIEGEPKTKKGVRVIALSPELVDLLARLQDRTDREREAWGEAYQDSGRVFTYEDGRQLRPGYPSKVLDTLIERAGLPRLRFHDLRHQYASILNDLGEDIVTISKLMGHANTAITSDLYTHMFEDKARRVAAATSSWFKPAEESVEGIQS
jgi:integrase